MKLVDQESEIEEIDIWTPIPIKIKPSNLVVELSQRSVNSRPSTNPEEVRVWTPVKQRLTREEITRVLLRICIISFSVGLVIFVFTHSFWLLGTSGLLPGLISWIVGYNFRQP